MVNSNDEKKEASGENLFVPVKPHFLINSLANIEGLMYTNLEAADDLIINLAGYIREIYASYEREWTTLKNEIELINYYLSVESVRFANKVEVCKNIEDVDMEIPPLIVEPLVENAIKHGIRNKEGKGTVYINIFSDAKGITIEVKDDGVGFDVDTVMNNTENPGSLLRVKEKVEELACGKISVESELNKGTCVTIWLPEI